MSVKKGNRRRKWRHLGYVEYRDRFGIVRKWGESRQWKKL